LGGESALVHHLAVLRAGDQERGIQLADNDALEEAIALTHARVVAIDPIAAYLGGTDSHRDADVRGLVSPLATLAERTGAAILGIMHLPKGTQHPAIYRAVGSIGFAAAARIVLAVAKDPERKNRRIMAVVKSNLSGTPPARLHAGGRSADLGLLSGIRRGCGSAPLRPDNVVCARRTDRGRECDRRIAPGRRRLAHGRSRCPCSG
jgi:hypothetical protein